MTATQPTQPEALDTFGKRLRWSLDRARRNRWVDSQNDAAVRAQTSSAVVSRYANHEREAVRRDASIVRRLAQVLHVNFDWLSTGEGEVSAEVEQLQARERTVELDRHEYTSFAQFRILAEKRGFDAAILDMMARERFKDGDPGLDEWPKLYDRFADFDRLLAKRVGVREVLDEDDDAQQLEHEQEQRAREREEKRQRDQAENDRVQAETARKLGLTSTKLPALPPAAPKKPAAKRR